MAYKVEIDVSKHKIDSVHLFYERGLAKVQRYVQIDLEVGNNEIVFKQIPNVIVNDSARVETLDANLTAEITRIVPGSTLYVASNTEDPTQKEINELQRQVDDNNRELATLDEIEKKLRKGFKEDADAQDLREWLDIYSEKRSENTSKMSDLKAKNEDLWNQMDKLRLQVTKNVASNKATEITATVKSDVACTAAIDFSYMVTAHWTPLYEIYISGPSKASDSNPVRLCFRASISQNTGEDWEDVVVTLSTNTGNGGAQTFCPAPVISSRPISLPPPMNNSVASLALPISPASYTIPPPICGWGCGCCSSTLTLNNGVFGSFQFVLDGKVTIKSERCNSSWCQGSSKHTSSMFTVLDMNLNSDLRWIVPYIVGSSVYVQCYVENQTPHPLLAGQGKLYIDDTYSNTISIPKTLPGEMFSFKVADDINFKVNYDNWKDTRISGFWKRLYSRNIDMHAVDAVSVQYTGPHAIGPVVVRGRAPRTWMRAKLVEPDLGPSTEAREVTVAGGRKVRWFFLDQVPGVSGIAVGKIAKVSNCIEHVVDRIRPGETVQLSSTWKETGRKYQLRR